MEIELLVVPDCPNEVAAAELLHAALEDVGLPPTRIRTTVIDTQQEAVARGFVGSPTILIDGNDPFAQPERAPAVACRVYATPSGFAGIPPRTQLRSALKRAAEQTGPAR